MENSESYSVSSVPGEKELLDELMPKLGMEATAPTGKYRTQARVRYFLPKVLIAALVIGALVFFGSYLSRPARLYDVSLEEDSFGADVAFHVDHLALLESVTATLEGRPLAVTKVAQGSYLVRAEKNGELRVVTRTFTGRQSEKVFSVDAVDEEPPHITDDELIGGDIYIYLSDGENGSGVNWEAVSASDSETGELFELAEVNETEGYVRFPFPARSVRIRLEDNNGNRLAVLLSVSAAGGNEPSPT